MAALVAAMVVVRLLLEWPADAEPVTAARVAVAWALRLVRQGGEPHPRHDRDHNLLQRQARRRLFAPAVSHPLAVMAWRLRLPAPLARCAFPSGFLQRPRPIAVRVET
jgi:hypothetical protein